MCQIYCHVPMNHIFFQSCAKVNWSQASSLLVTFHINHREQQNVFTRTASVQDCAHIPSHMRQHWTLFISFNSFFFFFLNLYDGGKKRMVLQLLCSLLNKKKTWAQFSWLFNLQSYYSSQECSLSRFVKTHFFFSFKRQKK